MSTIDDARALTETIEQRVQFEALTSELSSRFINLPAGEVDYAIEDAMRRVCEHLDIDLAVLWQWSMVVPDLLIPTHVYHARDVARPSEPMRQDQYPWARVQLQAGRPVIVDSLDALPAEAAVDRQTCQLYGIKSVMALPLAVGLEPPFGALGLNCLREERDWPGALVTRLQRIAQVLTDALVRARYEQRLLQSEARLSASAELAGLAFYEVDFGEGVAHFDDRLRELLGIPANQVRGLQGLEFWRQQLHVDDREHVLEMRRQLHAGTLERLSLEYRFVHPIRGERWFHHLGRVPRRDASGRALQSFGVLRDITEARRAEEALHGLSRRLIQAHEDERALLARELHDDVTQRLAVLAIEVGRAELAAPDTPQTDVLRSVGTELVRLSEDIHSLAYQLHPSVLEELGLVEALRAECERRQRQSRLEVSMELESSPLVAGKEAQLCLFRVAQEALTNVARHSGTTAARLTLQQVDDGLILAVSDDGLGFDSTNSNQNRSLGLASMRERVKLVNGTLDIESAPGQGTTLVAWVPAQAGDGQAR